MSGHTPGPWECDGATVFAVEHHGWRKGVEQFHNRFYAGVQRGPYTPAAELVANAKLISAAPDLLAALRDLADDIDERFDMESRSTNPGMKAAVSNARAAIVKATGVTP